MGLTPIPPPPPPPPRLTRIDAAKRDYVLGHTTYAVFCGRLDELLADGTGDESITLPHRPADPTYRLV